ncbi:MAG: EAL domain-containing protein [Gammaproteobacteria bacterium]|nr:EAL domain-containing protein [Gammaproteobacteria bacterium]
MDLYHSKKKYQPRSLRERYFSSTLVIGLIAVSIVTVFFSKTLDTKHEVSQELEQLQQQKAIVHQVNKNSLAIFRNIELFLLDPTIGYYDKIAYELISDTQQSNSRLNRLLAADQTAIVNYVQSVSQQTEQLENNVTMLFKSRLDINKQYPGIALSMNSMTEPHQVISSSMGLLIDEIVSGELEPVSAELLPLLLQTNSLWVNQALQFRSYLSNRFAVFSLDFLRSQADQLENMKQVFLQKIYRLEALYAQEDSFEAETHLPLIIDNFNLWHELFAEARRINESENWRTDNLILQQDIIPVFEQLSADLGAIETMLNEQEAVIKSRNERNTDTLFKLIVAIIVLFMLFILGILYSLDRVVFNPIKQVSKALKLRAFEHDAPQIKKAKSKEIDALVEAFKEMDEKVNQRQNELEHQALHDYLTALPNRLLLQQRLEYQLLTSDREQSEFSLFLMDLNNFKDVNDTLGHEAGDKLLSQVARRLAKHVRKFDTVARLGGDEFAVLLPDLDKAESEKVANNLHELISAPFMLEDQSIEVSISIGIVHYPCDGEDATTLLQHADSAMYQAKRNRCVFSHYDQNVDFYRQNRLTLIQDLRDALNNDELMLFYQPQLYCQVNEIVGAEALLRWNHPEFGFIQPEKIIDLAEYSGNIHQLTLWVITRAISECRLWHERGFEINVSINLSVQDLNNESLCEQIGKVLRENQLRPNYLTLEITESGMMENPALSLETLNKLKDMGIKLAVDDFGTGFSSLKYLKQLPVDELKIDRSFLMDMENDENDRVIVQSTINLGHNLGLQVVAEGVETEAILRSIDDYGCDRAQGYLFEKPLSSVEFFRYLKRNQTRKIA